MDREELKIWDVPKKRNSAEVLEALLNINGWQPADGDGIDRGPSEAWRRFVEIFD